MSRAGEGDPPPSFAPRERGARPSSDGARHVTPHPSTTRQPAPAPEPHPLPPTIRPEGVAAPSRPAQPVSTPASPAAPAPRRRWRTLLVIALALALAWPIGLVVWANGRISHVDALTGAPDTPGTTYLLVGSDSRADGTVTDGAEGQRSDTILLLHAAINGTTAMISLPRDTYVDIPGHGGNKLNASFSLGGAPLLTQTVENLTGLTVDHYVEIGMGGVVSVVDAAGGVNLCLDYDVNDALSGLVWTAGCRDVDGATALAFARMRYADPLGDIGRQARQRHVISALVDSVSTPATVLNPLRQVRLLDAGLAAFATDRDSNIVDLGRLAVAFRSASGADAVTGNPPISDLNYQPGGIGSTVLLDEARIGSFWTKLRDGGLTAEDVHQW